MLLWRMGLLRRAPKPNPRSLDALFPVAKVKRCPAGHSQTPAWKPSWGCSTCKKNEEAFAARALERTHERLAASAREREEWRAKLPPLPAVYVMVPTHGPAQVFRPGPRRRSR